MTQPEDKARENIDRMLSKAGWAVQDPGNVHLSAYRGLVIRNFTLKPGHGFAHYLLYVRGRAVGVVESFAQDDSYAEDIVQIVREEFGKGNEFAQKITYRTTGKKPEALTATRESNL